MRRWLVLLLLVPLVQAVPAEDALDDQEYGRTLAMDGNSRTEHWENIGQYGWYPQADVVNAEIRETEKYLIFEVELAATQSDPTTEEPPSDRPIDQWRYDWTFTYKGDTLNAGFERWGDDEEDVWFHVLEETDRGDGSISFDYRLFWFADARDDVPGYRAQVPKWNFRDADLVPIRQGDVLEDITFAARDGVYYHRDIVPCPNTDPAYALQNLFFSDCGWRVRDLMQDGDSLGDFTVELTPPGVGHLFMRMDDPIRQSNGLATTYLFEAVVHNLEAEADDVLVQVADIPDKWEVYHPAVVSFDGEGKTTVPIAVSVPFEHQHGVENFMDLTIVSERDPSVALSTFFGVFFADPAQPGGHHDTLYFHTDPESDYWAWMNTDKDSEEGAHGPYRGWNNEFVEGTAYSWDFWLSPGLDMGLDFDLSGTGELIVDVEVPYAFDGDVQADLVLWDWENNKQPLLATGSTAASLEAETPTEVRVTLTPEAFADRVPPASGRNLVLFINATSDTPAPPTFRDGGATIHTEDASLRLPLIDYHDDVDLAGLQVAAFDMASINGSARAVNPGRTSVVAFNVTNLLDEKMTLNWEIKGTAPFMDWVSVAPTTTHLAAGGKGTVVVRYTPPESATEEDIAEFVLIGRAREDDNRQAFSRVAFFIETERDIPDEGHIAKQLEDTAEKENAKQSKKSPGLPLVALLGVLAFALLRRRS